MHLSAWAARAVERGKGMVEEEGWKGEVHKPYTVPVGYVPPTLGEQFRFAARRHPYYRYGTAGALLFGLLGWALGTESKGHQPQQAGDARAKGDSSGIAGGREEDA